MPSNAETSADVGARMSGTEPARPVQTPAPADLLAALDAISDDEMAEMFGAQTTRPNKTPMPPAAASSAASPARPAEKSAATPPAASSPAPTAAFATAQQQREAEIQAARQALADSKEELKRALWAMGKDIPTRAATPPEAPERTTTGDRTQREQSHLDSVGEAMDHDWGMVKHALRMWNVSATEEEKANGPTDEDLARSFAGSWDLTPRR